MSDIVERLRKGIEWTGPTQDDTGQTENYMDEAADLITALRAEVERLKQEALFTAISVLPEKDAENERLRAALRKADEELAASGYRDTQWPRPDIRAALEKKP